MFNFGKYPLQQKSINFDTGPLHLLSIYFNSPTLFSPEHGLFQIFTVQIKSLFHEKSLKIFTSEITSKLKNKNDHDLVCWIVGKKLSSVVNQ